MCRTIFRASIKLSGREIFLIRAFERACFKLLDLTNQHSLDKIEPSRCIPRTLCCSKDNVKRKPWLWPGFLVYTIYQEVFMNPLNFLPGKKTYLVGAGIALTAAGGYLSGGLSAMDAITTVLNGLAFMFLRKGMKSS